MKKAITTGEQFDFSAKTKPSKQLLHLLRAAMSCFRCCNCTLKKYQGTKRFQQIGKRNKVK